METIREKIVKSPWLSGLILTVLSAIFIALSHVPFWPVLLFIAYIPLWLYWFYTPLFIAGIIYSILNEFIVNSIIYYWLGESIATFAQIDATYGYLAAFAINFFTSYNTLFTFIIWKTILKFVHPTKAKWLSLAILPIIQFLIDNITFKMFPKNFGYSWYFARWQGYQFADIVGIEGIGFVALCISVLFLHAIMQHDLYRKIILASTGTILILSINFLGDVYGRYWKNFLNNAEQKEMTFLLVQPNISSDMKIRANNSNATQMKLVQQMISVVQRGIAHTKKDIDLILWPETAFPYTFDSAYTKKQVNHLLEEYLSSAQIPLLTGAYSRKGTQNTQNAVFLLDPIKNTIPQVYSKQILVPFGEYLPAPSLFSWLKPYLKNLTFYETTEEFDLLRLHNIKLGTLICYEDLFSDYARKVYQKGPSLFVSLSNDKWFGETIEPLQHYIYGAARSIEYRLPMIRLSNGGHSGFIDELGNILHLSPVDQEWVEPIRMPVVKHLKPTFYSQYGHLRDYFLLSILMFFLFKIYEN